MADVLTYTSLEKKEIAKGLVSLVSTEDLSLIDTMDDGGVNALTTINKTFIDSNVAPPKKPRGFFDLFSADEPAPLGAKDTLYSYIKDAKDGKLTDPKKTSGLEAAMAAGGYKVVLDNSISTDEIGQLDDFEAKLKSGLGLSSMFNQNSKIAQAAAAQAEKEATQKKVEADLETDRINKYKAGLVYAGYLKPGENDPRAAAEAMSRFIVNDVPLGQGSNELHKMYEDLQTFKPTDYALTFLQEHTGNTGQMKVQADLESGDSSRIALAQNYMSLQGVTVGGAPMQANGQIYSGEFKNSAEEFIRRPLTMPAGLITKDGVVDTPKLWGMAAAGQLYLPESELKPEELAAAKFYKPAAERGDGVGLSREAFIASILIGNDPKRYEAILAKENEKRAGLTLNSAVQAMAAENVTKDVNTNTEKLSAIDLPANLGEKAMQLASQNNGYIKIEQIPYVLGQAQGNATTLTGGIDLGRLRGQMANMSQEDLSRSIKLDPSSPDFKANMIDFLKNAYVLSNAQTGATMNNIPQEVLGGFKDIADNQSKISNSLVVGAVQDFGLPGNLLTQLQDSAKTTKDGQLVMQQLPVAYLQTDPLNARMKANAANPMGAIERTDVYTLATTEGNTVIDKFLNEEKLDLKDPKQLALAIQMSIALKDNTSLKEVLERPGLVLQTEKLAEGFLGVNANKPDSKPGVTPPAADPDKGVPVARDGLSGSFDAAGVKPFDANTGTPETVVADNNNQKVKLAAIAPIR